MRVLDGREAASYVTEKLICRGSAIAPKVERTVAQIVRDVRANGDEALRKYARELDGLGEKQSVLVSRQELEAARSQVSPEFMQAIERAARNIRRFAEWQLPRSWVRSLACSPAPPARRRWMRRRADDTASCGRPRWRP